MKKNFYLLPLILALLISGTIEAKKKKYPNGDYYEGKWKKGTPHGFGTMIYVNGNTYSGNWVYGIKEGLGTMTYDNDRLLLEYTGEWHSNEPNGKGIMTYKNGDRYEGSWSFGEYEGHGILTFKDDEKYVKYEGDWKQGKQTGRGKIVFKNGNIYEGSWRMGEIFGDGVLTYANGDVFTGNWSENGRDGNLIMKSGGWCKGEWKNEAFYNGKCSVNTEDSAFEGEIRKGRFYNGKGVIKKGTNYYNGVWENGVFIGNCKITNINDTILSFIGNVLKDGSMNGTIEYEDDKKFSGGLSSKYIPNGVGKLSHKIDDFCSFEVDGYWKNGELLKLNKGYVTIEPIEMNKPYDNVILSNKQIIPLKIVHDKLFYANISVLNQYNRITEHIKAITDSIVDNIKENYITRNLKMFRTEDYKLCRFDRQTQGTVFLYHFDDAEYQVDPFTKKYHGKFHLWNGKYYFTHPNDIYSVQGQYKQGIKEGKWIYEKRNIKGELTGRLVINYNDDIKSGLSTLERIEKNGSKAIIRAYYDKDHWNNKGTSYYSYIYNVKTDGIPFIYVEKTITAQEQKITFDENGEFHGNIFIKLDDIELKGEFNHGELIQIEKRNVKKNVVLTPVNGKEEFTDMLNLVLPGTYNPFSGKLNSQFDDDPFIGLTLIDLTAEGSPLQASSIDKIEKTKY